VTPCIMAVLFRSFVLSLAAYRGDRREARVDVLGESIDGGGNGIGGLEDQQISFFVLWRDLDVILCGDIMEDEGRYVGSECVLVEEGDRLEH
jgi:hypothetical protein